MNIRVAPIEPDPLEMDPRSCELCGLTADRHEMVDDGEGPIFYCPDLSPDEMTLDELERRGDLRHQEDIAAILARWEAMDEAMDRARQPAPARAASEPSRPAQSTVDAFFYLVGTDDIDRLKAWLLNHPRDVPFLLKLLESKRC
jgi:hypothetical protein